MRQSPTLTLHYGNLLRHMREAATHLATAMWASLEDDYCFYTALWKSVGIHDASFGLDKEIFKYIPLVNSVEKCSICLVP